VGAALGGVLAVYKAVVIFAIIIVMRNGHFNVLAFQVNDRVPDFVGIGFPLQQVNKPFLETKLLPLKMMLQAGIQKAIVPDLLFEVFGNKMKVFKNPIIRNKRLPAYRFPRLVRPSLCSLSIYRVQIRLLLFCRREYGSYFKIMAQGIYRLGTYAVQAHAFLKHLAVVLGAGVDLAHHIHHFAQRNAPAIVANGYRFPSMVTSMVRP
jgi:hypothetical protein